jgi:sulfopyruvate decarboxylase subunit alpha
MQLDGQAVATRLAELGFTHVVWLPDSAIGPWEKAFENSPDLRLVRVCREGEAWGIASGLQIGGARPIVVIQSTGFFESGDSLRNALFDLKLPLYAIVGHRSSLVPNSPDTARHFLEPILRAWGIDFVTLDGAGGRDPLDQLQAHLLACRDSGKPGVALLPEGKM